MSVAEIAKRFRVPLNTIYRDLNHQHDKVLAALGEYGQFRRRENERELEALKALYTSYIFNPNVVIRGTEVDSDGKTRVIELSHFDAMLKVSRLYLAAMNIQNKMWGLYTVPQAKTERCPGHDEHQEPLYSHGAGTMAAGQTREPAAAAGHERERDLEWTVKANE